MAIGTEQGIRYRFLLQRGQAIRPDPDRPVPLFILQGALDIESKILRSQEFAFRGHRMGIGECVAQFPDITRPRMSAYQLLGGFGQ